MSQLNNYPAKKIALSLENSFWLSNDKRLNNSVIGFRLRNEIDHPYTNFEYPYQLVINYYSPGYSYFADQTQFRGGIKTNGHISYQYGWEGYMIDDNTIFWENDGSLWTRVTVPPNKFNNKYDAKSIYAKEKNMTSYLFDKMQSAYPLQPGLPGL